MPGSQSWPGTTFINCTLFMPYNRRLAIRSAVGLFGHAYRRYHTKSTYKGKGFGRTKARKFTRQARVLRGRSKKQRFNRKMRVPFLMYSKMKRKSNVVFNYCNSGSQVSVATDKTHGIFSIKAYPFEPGNITPQSDGLDADFFNNWINFYDSIECWKAVFYVTIYNIDHTVPMVIMADMGRSLYTLLNGSQASSVITEKTSCDAPYFFHRKLSANGTGQSMPKVSFKFVVKPRMLFSRVFDKNTFIGTFAANPTNMAFFNVYLTRNDLAVFGAVDTVQFSVKAKFHCTMYKRDSSL